MGRAVVVQGIECPIIREGDDIVNTIVSSVLKQTPSSTVLRNTFEQPFVELGGNWLQRQSELVTIYGINDKDVIGITESIIARAAGQYITVDEIASDIENKFGKDATICLANPIYSRNRFSLILKGIARAAKKVIIVMPEYDEVRNPRGVNKFTGVNIEEYYKELCEKEGCECQIIPSVFAIGGEMRAINCGMHPSKNDDCYFMPEFSDGVITLADICSDKSPDWGLLGTNKATEEKLKLFPSKAESQRVCEAVKTKIKEVTGKDVVVCVYGDGCFKDPVGGIWEFADPITMPGYTDKELIESTPNEIKLKSLIDSSDKDSTVEILTQLNAAHNESDGKKLFGGKGAMGTTPRLRRDLLASLMDLTSGSGDRATPVVLVKNFFA